MSNLNRLGAIKSIASRQIPAPQMAAPAEIGIYAEDVFNEQTMRAALPQNICEKLLETIRDLTPLDPAIANDVAQAMKCWALDRGATHYTHWFLPLNGSTAEKHDAMIAFTRSLASEFDLRPEAKSKFKRAAELAE